VLGNSLAKLHTESKYLAASRSLHSTAQSRETCCTKGMIIPEQARAPAKGALTVCSAPACSCYKGRWYACLEAKPTLSHRLSPTTLLPLRYPLIRLPP
jgi:hypothetical protein